MLGFDCTYTLAVESVDVEEDTQLTSVAFFLVTYTDGHETFFDMRGLRCRKRAGDWRVA